MYNQENVLVPVSAKAKKNNVKIKLLYNKVASSYLSAFYITLNIDKLRLKFSYEQLAKQGKPGPAQWTVLGKKEFLL